jgi:flagellar basal-body rod protein FlgG
MIRSLNTAATGMAAQQTNMDTIANNIANSQTTGFKASRAEFEDLLYQTQKEPGALTGENAISPTGVQVGLGVRTGAVQKDFTEGNVTITRAPLDLMIEGPGFFRVQTPDGQIAYTRDGSFKRDGTGKIIDKNGNVLQPEVTIPPGSTGIEISNTGQIRVKQGNTENTVGNLTIVNFVNPAGLKSVGKNIYLATPSSGQPIDVAPGQQGTGYLEQGQLETSNVNIANEMVNMILAQRAYETNSKVIHASDQMLQSTVNMK